MPSNTTKRRRKSNAEPLLSRKRVRNIRGGGGDLLQQKEGNIFAALPFAKNVALLSILAAKKKANSQFNKRIIDSLNSSQMGDVQKIVSNFLKGRYTLPSLQLKRLAADKKYIYQIANSKVPMNVKKRILKQKGGFLPALIPLAAKTLGPVILGAAVKKVFRL